jgi:hypothetical protein
VCTADQTASVCNAVPGTPAANDPTCNNVDDDCDGSFDENFPSQPTACGTGACARTGSTSCVAGQVQDSCTPGASSPEACNSIDDDCDGSTDEELGQTTCGVGACQRTVDNCVAGVPQSCTPGPPEPDEICGNALDDDCDGATDENCP